VKVAVLNNSAPFIRGGAEFLADSLVAELGKRGHDVELVKVPLRWATCRDIAESMAAAASLRIPEADRVIALKFPAYLVPHQNKVVWLLHQFRQVYELWDTPYRGLPDGPETDALRRAIVRADGRAFRESQKVLCNSTVTQGRLRQFNAIDSEVLLAPHSDLARYQPGPFGDYVLAIGRITESKRQHLLAEAMARVPSGVRLVIAGAPEDPADLERINKIVAAHGLGSRVEVIARFISDEEKARLISHSRAVAYLPVDEDSYGYVTAEAMTAGKPVITCADSGGILELVEDGRTGIVAEPNPESVAAAITRIGRRAQPMGAAAATKVKGLGLSWDRAIERLLT
jgi:glycosyltransferase involved in cell wall biosynthesis